MKHLYFVLILLITKTGFSQEKNSLTRDQDTLVKTNSIQLDSVYTILPGMSDSGFVYTLPNSLMHLPFARSSVSLNLENILKFQDLFIEFHYNAEGARQDLKEGIPKILFPHGSAFGSERDTKFQRKYLVEFFAHPFYFTTVQHKDKKAYNQIVFAYLDKKYGTKWRHELRSDAIGFERLETIESEPTGQLDASLQVPRTPPSVYSRFPPPTDPDEKHQLLIIKIVSVSLVILLILYLLFRRRNRKTFID